MRLFRKYDLFLGFVVLALSILGIILIIAAPIIPSRLQNADFAQICNGEKSSYYTSDLYNAEKKSFSEKAKAYQVLYFGGERLRVVADARLIDNKKIKLIVSLSNAGRQDINLRSVKFSAKLPDKSQIPIPVDEKNQDLKVSNLTVLTVSSDIAKDYTDKSLSVDLQISDLNHNCSLTIAQATQVDLTQNNLDKSSLGGINVGEFGKVNIPIGSSPIGFSDWRLFTPFYDKKISIFSFDGTTWQEVTQKGDFIAQPGIGYYLYNPLGEIVEINPSMFFEVPPDVIKTEVHPGWNLLYNDFGRDAKLEDLKVNAWPKEEKRRSFISEGQSLQSLISQNLASGKIYLTDDPALPGNQGLYPLATNQLIPEGSIFWFYVFALPKTQAVLPNFDFTMTTDKEQYKHGSEITLTYKIVNKDDKSHIVDSSKENDPCQIGLEVFDEKGRKIYSEKDNSKKQCPLWPQNITLGPSETVEYSQKWKIPDYVEGKVKLRGYFDYTRLNSSDIINSEVETKVEK